MAGTKIALVGGFLGAGKTSLLLAVARSMAQKRKTVGFVTNDQAAGLVDTAFLRHSGGAAAEVYGSCFCCDFPGFAAALAALLAKNPELILAEPVGSCTDLSATVIQPLKEHVVSDGVAVAPLSVVVSPTRLEQVLQGAACELHPSAAYIVKKQLDEADIILINKIDMLSRGDIRDFMARAEAMWPGKTIFAISAASGEGVEEWLEELARRGDSGNNIVEVDYDVYAEGEAVLGWFNATVALVGSSDVDWDSFAGKLIAALKRRFAELSAPVAHVKLLVETADGFVKYHLADGESVPSREVFTAGRREADMTLNARVQIAPGDLEAIVKEELAEACGTEIDMRVLALRSLSPGYPNPTYRYKNVVRQ